MKKFLFFPLFACFAVNAQKPDKDLWDLVETERAFSKMAGDKNIRDAFVYFFAPNSIAIDSGKEVNGLEHSKKIPVRATLAVWEPSFADISSSKDFGYTTGPLKIYKTRLDTIPALTIYYSSVWEKQPSGEWKVLIDVGNGQAETVPPSLTFSKKPLTSPKDKISKGEALQIIFTLDKQYVSQLNSKNATVVSSYFSDEGRVHRPRTLVVKGKAAIDSFSDLKENKYVFKHLNGRIANSADMAITYGTVDITLNTTAKNASTKYLRIWKKEDSNWQIVLDVIE